MISPAILFAVALSFLGGFFFGVAFALLCVRDTYLEKEDD